MSFQEALLSGYAPDGGLYVPESLPKLSSSELQSWAGLSYPQVVEKLLHYFVPTEELNPEEIHGRHCV